MHYIKIYLQKRTRNLSNKNRKLICNNLESGRGDITQTAATYGVSYCHVKQVSYEQEVFATKKIVKKCNGKPLYHEIRKDGNSNLSMRFQQLLNLLLLLLYYTWCDQLMTEDHTTYIKEVIKEDSIIVGSAWKD